MKPNKAKLFLYLLLIFSMFFALLELSYRAVVKLVKGPKIDFERIVSDKKFGWTHNVLEKIRPQVNKCGEKIIRTPDKHPLICHFSKYCHEKSILILGDSFTHAWHVSTGKRYYDILEETLKDHFRVYAAGTGGYGTVQEFMALKEIHELIKPDIVIWQLCGNDVSNNVYEFGDNSPLTKRRPRPYFSLQTEKIEIQDAGTSLFDISHLSRFIYARSLIVDKKLGLGIRQFFDTTEKISPEDEAEYIVQGLAVMDRMIGRTVADYAGIKLYAFSVDDKFDDEYAQIFRRHNAVYFDDFYENIDRIENTNCKPLDKHWNHLGHQIAAETLTKLIYKHEINKPRKTPGSIQ